MSNESDGARPNEISIRDAAEQGPLGEQPLALLAARGHFPGATYRNGTWFLPRTAGATVVRDCPSGLATSAAISGLDWRP